MNAASPSEFSSRVRKLSRDDQAAFVADLLEAQGWDVDREGSVIHAMDDESERTFSVGVPPGDIAVDLIVAPPPSRIGSRLPWGKSPEARAADLDAELLDTEDLRNRLLYAIDRTVAGSIVEKHFDTQLEVTPEPETEPGTSVPTIAVAVVVLIVIGMIVAAPVVFDGTDRTDESELGDDASPEEDELNVPPPGVSSEEIEDPDLLAMGHKWAIQNTMPFAISITYSGPRFLTGQDTRRTGYGPDERAEYEFYFQSEVQYYIGERHVVADPLRYDELTIERVAKNGTEYQRIDENDEQTFSSEPVPDDPVDMYADRNQDATLIRKYLDTNETSVETIERENGSRYSIVATGDPARVDVETDEYRATAIVRPDGVVTRLSVEFVHPETSYAVRIEYEFNDSADIEATRPEWIDERIDES